MNQVNCPDCGMNMLNRESLKLEPNAGFVKYARTLLHVRLIIVQRN